MLKEFKKTKIHEKEDLSNGYYNLGKTKQTQMGFPETYILLG